MIGRRGFLIGALLAPAVARAEYYGTPSDDGGLSLRPAVRPAPSASTLVDMAGLSGSVAYAVLDPATGAIRDAVRADAPLPPASTLKAITAIYALDRLGPDHQFRTRVLRAGDMLILAGGGDPHLDTDRLAALAADLARQTKTSPARFAVWGGALPQVDRIVPEQAEHLSYNPALSGMILNFNRVHLGWRQQGGDYTLSLEARASAHSPRAYTVTARPGDQRALFTYSADAAKEHWVISRGAMGRAGSRWLPVRRPELYAGDVFQTLCRAQGLVLPTPEVIGTLPPDTQELAASASPPLRDILRNMLVFSTNLTAEVIGLHASGARDLAASAAAMTEWLRGQAVAGEYHFVDHSGLSGDSRITPLAMARALAGPGRAAGLAGLVKADPLSEDLGDDGQPHSVVRAKTGTLNFVSNLAGYAEAQGREGVVFAIFCHDPARRAGTEGQELPAGVSTWTRKAKTLQRSLIDAWVAGV